jgi:hypothetical protein
VAQLGARLDGIEEVVGSNPIGSTTFQKNSDSENFKGHSVALRRQYQADDLAVRLAFSFVQSFAVKLPCFDTASNPTGSFSSTFSRATVSASADQRWALAPWPDNRSLPVCKNAIFRPKIT